MKQLIKSIYFNPGNKNKKFRRTFDAIKWQFRKRILKSNKVIKLPNNLLFNAYPDCVVSSALIYSDWPEYRELMFLRKHLKIGELLIDIGANVGHISLLLADKVGPENVWAFEPTPISYKRLSENWRLNGLSTENLYQLAVGDKNSSVFIKNTSDPLTTNSIMDKKSNENFVEVEQVAIDNYLEILTNNKIGLIKIDVEGFELNVFKGAINLINDCRPNFIMFESLDSNVNSEILSILTNYNYVLFQLDEKGKPNFNELTAQNIFAVPNEKKSILK